MKIWKIDIWRNQKRIFRGFFSSSDHIKNVERLFKGLDVRIETHFIDADDDYYLQKAIEIRNDLLKDLES